MISNRLTARDVHARRAHDYMCTCMQCRHKRKRVMALYGFLPQKERLVVPTLSMCGPLLFLRIADLSFADKLLLADRWSPNLLENVMTTDTAANFVCFHRVLI